MEWHNGMGQGESLNLNSKHCHMNIRGGQLYADFPHGPVYHI